MKKFLSLLIAALLILGLAACGEKKEAEPSEPASEPEAKVFNIGVCQLVQHPALDAATQGFEEAVKAGLGDDAVVNIQNASGDSAVCSTIINGFVSGGCDLIMANATPALQAAAAATDSIPILGTSITEYGTALEIENFSGTVGGNISGTSDLAPLDEQAAMVKEWFPDAKTVGLVFCTAEANSRYQVNVVKAELEALGFTATEFGFTDSNDLAAVVQNACSSCDVLYIPTDNTCANNAESIANIAIPAKTPIIAGEENLCAGCGIATLSISYYDIGFKTGEMAVQILKGEADISQMPVAYAPQFVKKFNKDMCEALGIEPLEGYEAI
ncbi:MAG: ABC transporter substrate-binding protein [Firmicutes bacterium]|nr:ABC transporter substrate-binding protein [Bacillota bacterium]